MLKPDALTGGLLFTLAIVGVIVALTFWWTREPDEAYRK